MSTEAIAEIKFTPGPWKFGFGFTPETIKVLNVLPENDSTDGTGWQSKSITVCNERDEVLADVKAYTTSGFVQDFDQWAANARLIAAAPCMFNTLIEISKGQQGETKADFIGRIIALAEAAINKATL